MDRNDYVIDPDMVELERLKEQGIEVTKHLPELSVNIPFKKGGKGRIVDVACGAAEWANEIAKAHPEAEIIGFDKNASAIQYANEQARIRNINNAEFRVLDLFEPLPFEDDSCIFVNARFVVGVIPRDYWLPVLRECYRILQPGGVIQLVESEVQSVVGDPHYHALQRASYQAFWQLGKSFAPTEIALGPMLPKFLREASFSNMTTEASVIDYSFGTRAHEILCEDFILAAQAMQKRGLFTTYGGLTQQQYDTAFTGMCEEMRNDPNFAAFWYILRFRASKPALL